jgi:hypothetical protein
MGLAVMPEGIKPYIDDLFKYLDVYEAHYDEFKAEAFFQTYNGIYAVFQAMREHRERAIDVDQYFLDRIKSQPLSGSDLRQLTLQVLITYFESEADTDGQSNKSYLYCRDLRPVKRDVSYFEQHLVPLLFKEGSLNNNFRMNSFFLKEIGRYINKFAHGVHGDITPEEFAAMSDPMKFLELSRRRAELGDDLLRDRNSLEFHLQRVGLFEKLSARGRIFEQYLREWDYLVRTTFWSKVKSSLNQLWAKFKSLFASYGYFRLALTQRRPAYLLYGLIIIILLFFAVYIPRSWNNYGQNKLKNIEERAINTQNALSK